MLGKVSQHAPGQQVYGHQFFIVFNILLQSVPTVPADHLWLFSQYWEHMVRPWVFRCGDPPSDASSKMMVCCCVDALLWEAKTVPCWTGTFVSQSTWKPSPPQLHQQNNLSDINLSNCLIYKSEKVNLFNYNFSKPNNYLFFFNQQSKPPKTLNWQWYKTEKIPANPSVNCLFCVWLKRLSIKLVV